MALHDNVQVQLSGEDGNAFAILGRCMSAARKAGLSRDEVEAFRTEAMEGDYDHLLQTCMKYFDVM
tara:strand:- start:200 stop:397 length:198 start_codon:yes stop_codon:yes gene_type:complete